MPAKFFFEKLNYYHEIKLPHNKYQTMQNIYLKRIRLNCARALSRSLCYRTLEMFTQTKIVTKQAISKYVLFSQYNFQLFTLFTCARNCRENKTIKKYTSCLRRRRTAFIEGAHGNFFFFFTKTPLILYGSGTYKCFQSWRISAAQI